MKLSTLLLCSVLLMVGCAGAISRQTDDSSIRASGYLLREDTVNADGSWHTLTMAPTALDDDVLMTRTENEDGSVTMTLEKHAGEGKKLSFFDAAIGAVLGFLGAAAL